MKQKQIEKNKNNLYMKLSIITKTIEEFAPIALQESYDNAGLIVGSPSMDITAALLCIDVTEDVINEAIEKKANLIISHHPIIFSGVKKITGRNYVERCIIKAIKNDIAIYAAHTNIDAVKAGVNKVICNKLHLIDLQILLPAKNILKKLVTYVPVNHAEAVRTAICNAGAGKIGEYDQCSFNVSGTGTFRASQSANPYVGKINEIHSENEVRLETIFVSYQQSEILKALVESHPYEEVAYDIYSLDNEYNKAGMGMIGRLEEPIETKQFFNQLKEIFKIPCIKHTKIHTQKIEKVAVCGGSGAMLLSRAKLAAADIFITGDIKYHQFFDAENEIIIADIGHFESEQFTTELFYEILSKKFSNFAFLLSEVKTNPVFYY